jgi:hypothetical protein
MNLAFSSFPSLSNPPDSEDAIMSIMKTINKWIDIELGIYKIDLELEAGDLD